MKKTDFNNFAAVFIVCIFSAFSLIAKVKPVGQVIQLRPINIKNVAYASNGRSFTVPNVVTAGSVAVFFVSEKGEVGRIPSRFSDKDFVHTSGVFYYYQPKEQLPSMVFLPLQEFLTGYSVAYMPGRDTLAVAGTDKVLIYDQKNWRQVKSITLGSSTVRSVYSPDASLLGVISNGKLYMLETEAYSLLYTVTAEDGHQFADITFSNSGSKFAVYEYMTSTLDHTSRVRIYESKNGNKDRDLPYFPDNISNKIGDHYPILSYAPADSAIAVTLEKSFNGKVVLIKSNDGTLLREFKGSCHAFSADGTLFAAGGKVYSTSDWSILGNCTGSAVAMAFSPTERVLLVVTPENMRRYQIE